MEPLVLSEKIDSALRLTLNRPQRHNSLIPELLEALLAGIERAADSPDIKAVMLAARGRSFSTGGDVRAFYDHREEIEDYAHRMLDLLNKSILALLELPIPVVAAVHGIVTGGSLGLVLASDLVLVSPKASFTPYYPQVGFSPDGGWTALLPAFIGSRRAAQILLLNHTISADQALSWGVANRIVAEEYIAAEAMQTARALADMKAGSLKRTKRLLVAGYGDVKHRLERERDQFVRQIQTREALEGMQDFLNVK